MLYALVNGQREEATETGQRAHCPICNEAVIARCGETNMNHWAHEKDESCDVWYESETEWHKNWKLTFALDRREAIIKKDGKRHIADILTEKGVVVELQNSPISKAVIRQREQFYGENMLWIINGRDFKDNFHISAYNPYYRSKGSSLPEFGFYWKHARRTWKNVQRPVFIDFGDPLLYWITEGMGTSGGTGRYVEKEAFLKKYRADAMKGYLIIRYPAERRDKFG